MNNVEKLKEIINDIEYEKSYSCHLKTIEGEEDIIISSLEKQIPKKPNHIGNNYFHCPNGCEYVHTYHSDRFYYCPKCGQAIDWTDTP